jgi:Fic family protein
MKIPKLPPAIDLMELTRESPERFIEVLSQQRSLTVNQRYIHWHKLRFKDPPGDLTHEEWWAALKFHRRLVEKKVPLCDSAGNQFVYSTPDPPMPQMLHQVDLWAGGQIQMPEQIVNPETRDAYCISSLIDEAITSSQLEGATTTRPVAKQMIRSGRHPRDKSEQMILNNYLAMQETRKLKNQPLTKELVFKIHKLVSDKTLDDPTAAGRFRNDSEEVRIEDDYGQVFHTPPPADQLEQRMEYMCAFANSQTEDDGFVYPVIRSIILHFWLSYDHPFVDGNGRTARALFYWSMLKHGYWLCEFISISQIIRKGPAKYGKAFLYSETDSNDLTYFILYHLRIVRRAIDELRDYIRQKTKELWAIESELRGMALLNPRQRAFIGHALRHPNQRYTIESHKNSQGVVYQTARTDLLDLAEKGLVVSRKVGRTYVFSPAADLKDKLMNVGETESGL